MLPLAVEVCAKYLFCYAVFLSLRKRQLLALLLDVMCNSFLCPKLYSAACDYGIYCSFLHFAHLSDSLGSAVNHG